MRRTRLWITGIALVAAVCVPILAYRHAAMTATPPTFRPAVTAKQVAKAAGALDSRPDADLGQIAELLRRMAADPHAGNAFYGSWSAFTEGLNGPGNGPWRMAELRNLIVALADAGEHAANARNWSRAGRAFQLAVDATLVPVDLPTPPVIPTQTPSDGVIYQPGPMAAIMAVFPNDVLVDELRRDFAPLSASPSTAACVKPVVDQLARMRSARQGWGVKIKPVLHRQADWQNSPFESARFWLTRRTNFDNDQVRLTRERLRGLRSELPALRADIGKSMECLQRNGQAGK